MEESFEMIKRKNLYRFCSEWFNAYSAFKDGFTSFILIDESKADKKYVFYSISCFYKSREMKYSFSLFLLIPKTYVEEHPLCDFDVNELINKQFWFDKTYNRYNYVLRERTIGEEILATV